MADHMQLDEDPETAVDENIARRLADEHNLPPIEVDAALHGEPLDRAKEILRWVDEEERKLVAAHGLIAGRKLYRPVRMLRAWARKHGAGRRRSSS